jgi:hypothetical protein
VYNWNYTQLLGYKVEEKLHFGVRERKRLDTIDVGGSTQFYLTLKTKVVQPEDATRCMAKPASGHDPEPVPASQPVSLRSISLIN